MFSFAYYYNSKFSFNLKVQSWPNVSGSGPKEFTTGGRGFNLVKKNSEERGDKTVTFHTTML